MSGLLHKWLRDERRPMAAADGAVMVLDTVVRGDLRTLPWRLVDDAGVGEDHVDLWLTRTRPPRRRLRPTGRRFLLAVDAHWAEQLGGRSAESFVLTLACQQSMGSNQREVC